MSVVAVGIPLSERNIRLEEVAAHVGASLPLFPKEGTRQPVSRRTCLQQ